MLPDSKPGLVVRYDYPWSREAAAGRQQAEDRPVCLVAATDDLARPRHVVLLPITRTRPEDDALGVEIPATVKQAIGLDDEPSWVIVSEYNVDEWPNAGLSSVPVKPGVFGYGFIPSRLFKRVKARFLDLARQKRNGGVHR